ncbi:MAG TPA: TonB-dependent receptor [Candidatus Cloacimonadota bacterium]|nr:TonB-dependent receptor [Candidatus Cloacimonadota bacterium]HQB40305.1 TonB-dependent receptor [Candidatus Cloacimonadota bacterium]
MKKLIIALAFLTTFLNIIAQTIRVRVEGENNKPLNDVIINNGTYIQMTDSLGYFKVNRQEKAKDYTLSKTGYKALRVTKDYIINRKIVYLKRENFLLETINVTAKEEEISSQIRHKETINIDSVENKNLNSIADWLNNQQGIQIKGLDLIGEKKTLSLGGHSSRHTIIMLDGVVLNPTGQDIDLSTINQDNIESVEIIKNNASIEAGSGAIAGLIKIRSKRLTEENKVQVNNSFGSFNSIKNSINATILSERSQLEIQYSRQESENDFRFYNRQTKTDQTRENNNKFQEQLNVGGFIAMRDITIKARMSVIDYKNYLPGTYNYAQAFAGSFIKGYSFKNTINIISNKTEAIIYSNLENNNYQNLKSPILMYKADNKNYQQISGAKMTLMQSVFGFENKSGIEYKNEQFKTKDILKPSASISLLNRNTYSAYASFSKDLEYDLFDFNSSYSIRNDYSESFKNNVSWRFEQGIKYYSFIQTEVFFNYGTSYSLPSFYDLYWKGDSQTVGNPDLKPESSNGYRLGIKLGDNPSLEQAYWKNDTKNLIHWFRSLTAWKPTNIANAEIQNFETRFNYSFLQHHTFTIAYTKTITKDKSLKDDGSHGDFYNKSLIYTPEYRLFANYIFSFYSFNQNLELLSTGKQYSTRDQLKPPLPDYTCVNSHTSYMYNYKSYNFKFIGSLNNIFNEKYEIYDYIPEPGFNWQISLNIEKKYK